MRSQDGPFPQAAPQIVGGGRVLMPELRTKTQPTAHCDQLKHLETFAATLRVPRHGAAASENNMPAWKAYLILLPIVPVLDLLWLGLIMVGFYDRELGALARREGGSLSPRWIAAIMVYLLIPAGIVLFVRPRIDIAGSVGSAFLWGAAFGLILYGVYDFTNRSILADWSLRVTLADIAWGTTLCGVCSAVLQLIEAWMSSPANQGTS